MGLPIKYSEYLWNGHYSVLFCQVTILKSERTWPHSIITGQVCLMLEAVLFQSTTTYSFYANMAFVYRQIRKMLFTSCALPVVHKSSLGQCCNCFTELSRLAVKQWLTRIFN